MRKHKFVIGEYYHVYNRGTEKRDIVLEEYDLERFLESMELFNSLEPIGSIFEFSREEEKPNIKNNKSNKKLVSFVAFCVNPNHFHFLITPLVENGIEKFMHRIGGYTRYFNEKYKRSGALFQGRFKSKHISDNKYLLHLSAYINMNNRNKFGKSFSKLSESSLEEYIENKNGFCDKKIILEQFKNPKEYLDFALGSWQDSLARKTALKI